MKIEEKEIKNAYSPSGDEIQTKTFVEQRILDQVNATLPFQENWSSYDTYYMEAEDPAKLVGNNRVNFRTPFTQVRAKSASEDKRKLALSFQPKGDASRDEVDIFKAIWDNQWNYSSSDLVNKHAILVKNKYGTAIVFEGWKTSKREVYDPENIDEDGKIAYNKREIIDYDGVDTRVVDIRHWFPNEYSKDIRTMPDCSERMVMSYDMFEADYSNNPIYKNTEYVMDTRTNTATQEEQNTEERDRGVQQSKEVEVWHYWNKLKDAHIVIANGVLILDDHIPYAHKQLPYWTLYDYKEDDKFWGIGEIEIVLPFAKVKNKFGNMILDQAEYSINKPLAMSVDNQFLNTDDNLPTWGPGYILKVKGNANFEFMDSPPVGGDAWKSIDYINNEITVATGYDARAMISEQRAETATKEAIMKESQMERIADGQLINNVCGYKRMAELRKSNLRQFLKIKRAYEMAPDLFTENGYRSIPLYGMQLVNKEDGFQLVEDKGAVNYFEASPDKIRNDVDIDIITEDTMSASKTLDRALLQEGLEKSAPYLSIPSVAELPWANIVKKLLKTYNYTDEELSGQNKAQNPEVENQKEILKGKMPEIEEGENNYEHIVSHLNLIKEIDKEMEIKMKRMEETPPETNKYAKLEEELNALNEVRKLAVQHSEAHIYKAQQQLSMVEMPEGNMNPPTPSADNAIRNMQNMTAQGTIPPNNTPAANRQNMGERMGQANATPTL